MPVSAQTLLQLWERGRSHGLVHRAVMLAAAVSPGVPLEDVACFPAGERDGKLLALRESLFGSHMEALAACFECGEQVEWSFEAEQIRFPARAPRELTVQEGVYEVRVRMPSSVDLVAIAGAADAGAARAMLIGRCVPDAGSLPEAVLNVVIERMGEADPQANIQFELECPGCKHHWVALFDVCSYLWKEVDVWARRVLQEVHVLASAYGWSETEILSLSAWRRQFYLEMVGA